MTQVFDRATLDEFLEDVDLTLLVVVGSAGTAADAIHECAEDNITQPWRVTLWLDDTSLLAPGEIGDWELGDQRYVVLGIDADESRVAADAGGTGDLLRVDGEASILRIRRAFVKGDEL